MHGVEEEYIHSFIERAEETRLHGRRRGEDVLELNLKEQDMKM
jgi:hypothetical protein